MQSQRTSAKVLADTLTKYLLANQTDMFKCTLANYQLKHTESFLIMVINSVLESLCATGDITNVNYILDEHKGDYNVAAVCYTHYKHTEAFDELMKKANHSGITIDKTMLAAAYAQLGDIEKVNEFLQSGQVDPERVARGYRSSGLNEQANQIAAEIARQEAALQLNKHKDVLACLYQRYLSNQSLEEAPELDDKDQVISLLEIADKIQDYLEPNVTTQKFRKAFDSIKTDLIQLIKIMDRYKLSFEPAFNFYVLKSSLKNLPENKDKKTFEYLPRYSPDNLQEAANQLGLPPDCVKDILLAFEMNIVISSEKAAIHSASHAHRLFKSETETEPKEQLDSNLNSNLRSIHTITNF